MTIRATLKRTFLGKRQALKPGVKKSVQAKGGQMVTVKTFKMESLKLTKPRTDKEIRQAMAEGRVAELTPQQAGL